MGRTGHAGVGRSEVKKPTPQQSLAEYRKDQKQKLADDMCRLANDRTRLQFAFEKTLAKLGVPKNQIDKAMKDIRACDFTSIEKIMKMENIHDG